MLRTLLIAVLGSLIAISQMAPADAQFRLPNRLPDVRLPDTPLREAENLLDEIDDLDSLDDRMIGEIERQRRDAIDTLLGDHADLLERGPSGNAVLRGEILVVDPSETLLALASTAGFSIIEDRTEPALGLRYVRMRAPGGVATPNALVLLQQFDSSGLFDFNPIYTFSGAANAQSGMRPAQMRPELRIGMIDAGVPERSGAFAPGQVTTRVFRGSQVTPHVHGLQVASIMGSENGAAPGARIFAADVYGGQPTGGSADTLIRALAWMAEQDVRVVNISIVGPRNRALEAAVSRFIAQGRIIVAAVGNDGAQSDPLYPAAYEGVIAVTAIDADRRILPEAVQGDHVDFAARGMDMVWPDLDGRQAQVRGTSFAAPIVAGLLAQELNRSGSTDQAIQSLTVNAEDLGRRGRDRVYGQGAVGQFLFERRRTAQSAH